MSLSVWLTSTTTTRIFIYASGKMRSGCDLNCVDDFRASSPIKAFRQATDGTRMGKKFKAPTAEGCAKCLRTNLLTLLTVAGVLSGVALGFILRGKGQR